MSIKNKIKSVAGVVTVQVEGFFTERFLNLCKINNIKIWDIRNIVTGMVKFNIFVSDFKKLRKIARKTKCKVNIKNKKGMYFIAFKYRKRKVFALLTILIILIACLCSNFIWNIEIIGTNATNQQTILNELNKSGFKVGTFKMGIKKSDIIKNVRAQNSDISWIGIDISGTTAYVKVIEKTKIDENSVQETSIGNIVATKSGIVTKIIPENGTACVKQGSFVEKGMILIEGKIYSKILEIREVSAKGIIMANIEYENSYEYKYKTTDKNYSNKKRWNVGLTINNEEYMINYLNKSNKYDKIKKSKNINIFGIAISFDLYSFEQYEEVEKSSSKEELLNIAEIDSTSYLKDNILPNTINGSLIDVIKTVEENKDGIVVKSKYIINEQIGEFVKNEQ